MNIGLLSNQFGLCFLLYNFLIDVIADPVLFDVQFCVCEDTLFFFDKLFVDMFRRKVVL